MFVRSSITGLVILWWLILHNISELSVQVVTVTALHLPVVAPKTATGRRQQVTTTTSSTGFSVTSTSFTPDILTDRRSLLKSSKLLFATTVFGCFLSSEPLTTVAYAAYGDSSNIALPSYIDFLIEKNKQIDPSIFLYQGADRDVQLQRIATAVSKIQTIPAIVQTKKWSQVQGVITGPLGTLISTMNQIGGTNKEAQRIIVKVKSDLFSIGQCATTKNEKACLAATEATLQDVNDFVKVAF
jgi:hypothetical protein